MDGRLPTTLPATSGFNHARTHSTNKRWNCVVSMAQKNRRKVSSLGIPDSYGRYCRKNINFDLPNSSMSSQLSAPQITAHNVSNSISGIGCNFFRSIRGSSSCPKISKKSISPSSLIIVYCLLFILTVRSILHPVHKIMANYSNLP